MVRCPNPSPTRHVRYLGQHLLQNLYWYGEMTNFKKTFCGVRDLRELRDQSYSWIRIENKLDDKTFFAENLIFGYLNAGGREPNSILRVASKAYQNKL